MQATAPPTTRVRSLMPREHGAYGEIGFPVVTALAAGHPRIGAVAVALTAVAAFLAHEPILVLIGHRGAAFRAIEGPRATRRLIALSAVGLLAFVLALATMPSAARLTLLLPVALVVALGPFVRLKKERTAPGEILASAALSSAGVPIALAGGVALQTALSTWGVWTLAYSIATRSVREVIARARGGDPRVSRVIAMTALGILLAMLAAASHGTAPPLVPIGLAPLATFSIGLCCFPPSPRRLRSVGWLLIGASFVTTGLLVAFS